MILGNSIFHLLKGLGGRCALYRVVAAVWASYAALMTAHEAPGKKLMVNTQKPSGSPFRYLNKSTSTSKGTSRTEMHEKSKR